MIVRGLFDLARSSLSSMGRSTSSFFAVCSPWLALATGVAVCAFAPATAEAANCGTFHADDGDNVIVYGDWVREIGGLGIPHTRKLGVCWKDQSGQWSFEEVSNCTWSTPSTDRFVIYGESGDDVIVPSVRESPGMDFVCPDPAYDYPILAPMYVYPGDVYNPNADSSVCRARDSGCPGNLSFGITAYGGPGEDEIHGTASDDWIYSNAPRRSCSYLGSVPFCINTGYPADDASDVMCSYGGEDDLYGDDTLYRRSATCLDGGLGPDAGNDACFGGNGNVDRVNFDTCMGTRVEASGYPVISTTPADECCHTHDVPGCAPNWSDAVQECVCEQDSYCCNNRWDSLCVSEVDSLGCGSCSSGLGLHRNGCYDVCQHEVDDVHTSERWVVPPLYRIMEEAEGLDWIGRFTRPIYI